MFGLLRVGAPNTTTSPFDEAQRMNDPSMIEVSEAIEVPGRWRVVFGMNLLI